MANLEAFWYVTSAHVLPVAPQSASGSRDPHIVWQVLAIVSCISVTSVVGLLLAIAVSKASLVCALVAC